MGHDLSKHQDSGHGRDRQGQGDRQNDTHATCVDPLSGFGGIQGRFRDVRHDGFLFVYQRDTAKEFRKTFFISACLTGPRPVANTQTLDLQDNIAAKHDETITVL